MQRRIIIRYLVNNTMHLLNNNVSVGVLGGFSVQVPRVDEDFSETGSFVFLRGCVLLGASRNLI